jgi:prepilin signal peptidase PulO-like enzyme (type II secretory pathway)
MPVHISTASLWATVAAHFIVFGIFLLAVWILCKKAVKENEPTPHLPFCLSMAVGLILLLVFGVTITTVKGMILTLLLLYASLSDFKTRTVPDCISLMILILSFVGFEAKNLPSMLVGSAVVFIPQLALAMLKPNRAIGGADLKISTALAFLLGAEKGVFAFVIGMLLAVVTMVPYNKVTKQDQMDAFPLVPFLWVGATLAYLI